MKLILLCVGTLKSGPEKDLFDHYCARLSWPLEVKEIVCRKQGSADQIKEWEGTLLCQSLESNSFVIGLDERGKLLTSFEFAQTLEKFKLERVKTLTFVIGGADGLSDSIRSRCHHLVSFGRLTWPHMLVRGMLAEQLYRAQQILNGHPYHRA
ncbi:MAG: 23S rRNA (pseudouridine(1915)-N(3))-methyltransferase RlmH [Alphaproteobacteria bacterium]|nr:23S rRNA (pseudouridine(1915)-N(3))-methyltransferase RlmH [Alphaproteobacteria bacterium]